MKPLNFFDNENREYYSKLLGIDSYEFQLYYSSKEQNHNFPPLIVIYTIEKKMFSIIIQPIMKTYEEKGIFSTRERPGYDTEAMGKKVQKEIKNHLQKKFIKGYFGE